MNSRVVLSFLLLTGLFSACSSANRRPASIAMTEPTVNPVVIHELEPYLMKENHPGHYFLIDASRPVDLQTDYFSKVLGLVPRHDQKKEAPSFEAMISCDAPFEFREDLMRTSNPGPSQVRFRLYDNAFKHPAVSILLGPEANECRLFVKLTEQPKVVYGLRLVTQPDPVEAR